MHSNENDSLSKLSDIIPENDKSNRRDKGKKGNRNNPIDTPRDTPRNGRGNQTQRGSSNKIFKNKCSIHKNHKWTDCRINPVNSGGNKNSNDRERSRIQEHRHNRRIQTSNPPSKSHSPSRRNNARRGRHRSSRRQENNRIRRDNPSITYSSRSSHESFRIERLDIDEDEETPKRKESYKISESKESNKEINGGEILLTIPAVQDYPKRTIICLLDSGSSSSLLNYDVANRNVKNKTRHKEVWDTKGGTFTTFAKTTILDLQLPQFTTRRNFRTEMHLFERKKDEKYDAIKGRDLMIKVEIFLDYKKEYFA